MRRSVSHDKIKEKFQTFRKNVLENSLKDYDLAKEDIRDVTLMLPPTGIGNVDAQLSGYATLYNDHLERWKNLKKLLNDFKKTPSIAEKSRDPMTFRSALVTFHKICDDIKSTNSDLHIRAVSEFCFLVDYKPASDAEDKSQQYAAILIFNQINRDLREFIERGPSLARLLKSIAGGVRFQEAITVKETVQPSQETEDDEVSDEAEDEEEQEERDEGEAESPDQPTGKEPTTHEPQVPATNEDTHVGICAERENLDLSIFSVSLNTEDKDRVMRRYKHNLEMLGRSSTIVEVLDLAAKSLWQNIHDELADKDS